jgi:glucose/arabinose dehydrogenase
MPATGPAGSSSSNSPAASALADGHCWRRYLDIRDRVDDGANEQGLLGLAFHPNYAENGYFYVNYTRRGGDTVIARFQAGGDSITVDPDSEKRLIEVDQPYANHNGGAVVFADGYLYLGLGDGARRSAGNAQS